MIVASCPLSPLGLAQMKADEGFRTFPYDDHTGLRILAAGNITVGYGTNLSAGLSLDEAAYLLNARLGKSQQKLTTAFSAFAQWPALLRDILVSIDYNTGDVLEWGHLITSIAIDSAPGVIARNIRDSQAWDLLATHARYERYAVAVECGGWHGADPRYGEQGDG